MIAEKILKQLRLYRQQQLESADVFEQLRIIERQRTQTFDPIEQQHLKQFLNSLKGNTQ